MAAEGEEEERRNPIKMAQVLRRQHAPLAGALCLLVAALGARAVLIQPYNYMLDAADASLLNAQQSQDSSSGGAEHEQPDQDIAAVLGDNQAEVAELLQRQLAAAAAVANQESAAEQQQAQSASSLSSSVASLLLNAAQVAAAQQQQDEPSLSSSSSSSQRTHRNMMELDTSGAPSSAGQLPNKADLKQAPPTQWFNPKETIPVLKISSMG